MKGMMDVPTQTKVSRRRGKNRGPPVVETNRPAGDTRASRWAGWATTKKAICLDVATTNREK